MFKTNKNYLNLKESYLFTDIAKKVAAYSAANPDKKLIKMGIGDVTQPLIPEVVEAMKKAAGEMGVKESFRGYGPEQGYGFLREKIAEYYLREMNVKLAPDEIFVSDGAKSDVGNFTDLLSNDNVIVVPDPVYPVYVDSNVMLGRKINYISGNESNNFLPLPDDKTEGDVFYLCSPNNPTGATFNRDQLRVWVEFALKKNALILFDSAYEAFVQEDLPRSIYEIEGADRCAVEFCSFSKTAGFTGTRCGYTVVPKNLVCDGMSLNKMWLRRQTTKFNGVSYVTQRGAEAVFSEQGLINVRKTIDLYRGNAKVMTDTVKKAGIWFTGGVNSPYVWIKCPHNMSSWEFFDYLLNNFQVVGTPGSGFGKNGEGYFRLTAFNTLENTIEAMNRLSKI
ncbi:MAG: LL-diaminopimelate aminotransferase [Clostridia bacterium]|nr:LL-diaminopimelate aminotransferase [Clostridia bacterium]